MWSLMWKQNLFWGLARYKEWEFACFIIHFGRPFVSGWLILILTRERCVHRHVTTSAHSDNIESRCGVRVREVGVGVGVGGCLQNTSVTRPGASRLSTFHSLKSGDNSPPMFLSRPFIPRQSLRLRSWQSVGVSRHAEVHHWGAGQGPHGGGHSQSLGNPLSSQTPQTGIGIDIISHSRHAQERSEVRGHLSLTLHSTLQLGNAQHTDISHIWFT